MAEVSMTVSVESEIYVLLLRAANESRVDPGHIAALIIENYLEDNDGSL